MTWRVIHASEIGTSHRYQGTLCQDESWAQAEALTNGEPLLTIFVSDGAGSAAKGGDGAATAIEVAAGFMKQKISKGEFGLSDQMAAEIVCAIRHRISSMAADKSLTVRDFACTFLGLISTRDCALVFQIGDGGVVVDVGSGLELAFVPMRGEYVNMTHFVTDENAVELLKSVVFPAGIRKAAVFTDGIERIALNLASNTPHEPFFTPFFNGMAKAQPEQEEQLQHLLVKFLQSPAVNERIDDDKTLALALWMEPQDE